MTNRARTPCRAFTHAGRSCRRVARWCVPGHVGFYCKPHAIARATPEGGTGEIVHALAGDRLEVAPPPTRRRPAAPRGEAQIIRELRRVRTRRHLHEVRMAIATQLPDLTSGGGLTPDLRDALAHVHARLRRTA